MLSATGLFEGESMKFVDRYPIIVTPHKNACRDFWAQYLGFDVVFDSTWSHYSPQKKVALRWLS
jgi:hypothetical protein